MFCHLIIVTNNKYRDIEKTELYYDNNEILIEVLELLYNADFAVQLNLDLQNIEIDYIRDLLIKIEPDFIDEINNYKNDELYEILKEWFKEKNDA